MKVEDFLRYKYISLLLTGNDNGIRKDKCPKKHQEQVKELESFVEFWINKHSKDKK